MSTNYEQFINKKKEKKTTTKRNYIYKQHIFSQLAYTQQYRQSST